MSHAAAIARSWIGTPYVHQASCQGAGADCLGLVRGVWRALHGAEPQMPPAYTGDWGEPGGEELLHAAALAHLRPAGPALAPGQVALFRMRDGAIAKHLAIVGAADPAPTIIHAYEGQGVTESPLTPPWRRRIVALFDFPEV